MTIPCDNFADDSTKAMLPLIRECFEHSKYRHWVDFCLSVSVGYVSLFAIIIRPAQGPILTSLLFVVSYFAIFRSLCFLHETYHFKSALFTATYDILVGIPFMLPAYVHATHGFHHGKSTYGTRQDPEYDDWSGRPYSAFAVSVAMMVLMPLIHGIRFGLVGLVMPFVGQGARKWIYQHASTFAMNPRFVRPLPNRREKLQWMIEDAGCFLFFWMSVIAIVFNEMPLSVVALWYSLCVCVYVGNLIRALSNHRYVSDFTPKDMAAHLNDSVTVIGPPLLTDLWSPLGLQYHALHHLFPSLPYYKLKQAHEILMRELPASHPYRSTVERSLLGTLSKLFSHHRRQVEVTPRNVRE